MKLHDVLLPHLGVVAAPFGTIHEQLVHEIHTDQACTQCLPLLHLCRHLALDNLQRIALHVRTRQLAITSRCKSSFSEQLSHLIDSTLLSVCAWGSVMLLGGGGGDVPSFDVFSWATAMPVSSSFRGLAAFASGAATPFHIYTLDSHSPDLSCVKVHD